MTFKVGDRVKWTTAELAKVYTWRGRTSTATEWLGIRATDRGTVEHVNPLRKGLTLYGREETIEEEVDRNLSYSTDRSRELLVDDVTRDRTIPFVRVKWDIPQICCHPRADLLELASADEVDTREPSEGELQSTRSFESCIGETVARADEALS